MKYLLTLLLFTLPVVSLASKMDTYIPKNAPALLPLVDAEVQKYKTPFDAGFIAGSIEQESCISLTHSRCWKSTSELATRWRNGKRREQGIGLTQLTRTWRKSGRLRFDTLTRLKKKYRTHLKELNWRTVKTRPDMQIRAGVLLYLENWHSLPSTLASCQKLPMILSGYNQGMGGVKKDRRLCGLKRGCDPKLWFDNVANVKRSGFGTRILYGKRTAHRINRTHVDHVLRHRMPKYRKWYKEQGLGN